MVRQRMEKFVHQVLPSISEEITITKLEMPWRRMFEVDLEVQYRDESVV